MTASTPGSKRPLEEQVLEILEQNARMPSDKMATLLGVDEAAVESAIQQLEDDKVILGYRAVTDPAKTTGDSVTCLIEVRVSPQRGVGFDRIAERIYRYPEVKSLFLMSGAYDLLVVIEGKTIQDISYFVFEKLATLDHIQSTTTHFMLKKYKDNGITIAQEEKSERLPVAP